MPLIDITPPSGHPDRIFVRDMVVATEIGAFGAERGVQQRLRFNIIVDVAPKAEPHADDVDRTLSYDVLTQAVARALGLERVDLLETLAERIAADVLMSQLAQRIFVRIEKLDRGPGELGVEIVRDGATAARAHAPAVQPIIAFFAPDACGGALFSGWLDQLAHLPLIIIPGFAPLKRPLAGTAEYQHRVDLLALEQSAWCLASRDDRCVVVSSRTELEWGLQNQQISVWAPSKMVIDASPDQRQTPPAGAALVPWLASWLAGEMSAREVLWFADAPQTAITTPLRIVDSQRATLDFLKSDSLYGEYLK